MNMWGAHLFIHLFIGRSRRRSAWGGLLLLVLAGCGGVSVTVPPAFPVPVVERMPLRVGLKLDEALTSYVFSETLEASGEWEVALGSAQTEMFQNLLTGMFEEVTLVDGEVQGTGFTGDRLAGVLVPSIEEVQISTPDQTRTDYFEVWIRYQFQLYDRHGALVSEWPLTAYGKANARNYGLQSRAPGLMAAALAACRDAMAFFTVQFHAVPGVRPWLAAELGNPPS